MNWRKSSRSNATGGHCVEVAPAWRKSSRSNGTGGECVEVAPTGRAVAIRDSKNPDGPMLTVTPNAWQALTQSLRDT